MIMDGLDRKVLAGLLAVSAVTITLFAFMYGQQESAKLLDDDVVEGCRSLVRESADILVEVARDNLGPDNQDTLPRLYELQTRIHEIEIEMSDLRCHETQEGWAYGSFRQEMSEYEAYIAELVKNSQP